MSDLKSIQCEACTILTPKLNSEQIDYFAGKVQGWTVVSGHHLYKKWIFKNFAKPLKFVMAISELAEKEGHHPNINFGWGYVEVTIWTHVIKGLSMNDFILSAKIDTLRV